MRELEEVPSSKKREKANLPSTWQLWVYNDGSTYTMPTLTTITEWMKMFETINMVWGSTQPQYTTMKCLNSFIYNSNMVSWTHSILWTPKNKCLRQLRAKSYASMTKRSEGVRNHNIQQWRSLVAWKVMLAWQKLERQASFTESL